MALYTESNDIFNKSFLIEIDPNDILTTVRYYYGYNYAKSYWHNADLKTDEAQATIYLKDYEEDFGMDWVRHQVTAADIAERKLNFRKSLQTNVKFNTSLHGLDDDILSDIQVEHDAGPTLGDVTIIGMDINLDTLTVSVKALAVPSPVTYYLLLENGDRWLLENGDNFVKESVL